MMPKSLMQYFNQQPRLGVLSTAAGDAKPNVAYFGSPRMVDEKTVTMGLGKNRSLENLQQNPFAVYMIMEPGPTMAEWRGLRIYMKMTACETFGKKLDYIRDNIASVAGKAAAKQIQAAVTFEVQTVRPLADFGQGWEASI
jgi:hypothetical protein